MSLALARKYRPKSFADVAVQGHVSNTLKGAISLGRVAHGYLLCGPRGVGKTTLARVLAMALNCENKRPDGEPCGECASCTRIWSGQASLDVVEIDAASNRGVDDARELRERAMYAPSGDDRWKVYIVDEAHMLTREAWNALLKILEEPPPRVVFVFATTEPQKIAQSAAPVLSRLQRFDFRRIAPADIRERLGHVLRAERVDADADALTIIARAADGSMRDALSLTDQVLALGAVRLTAESVREALGLVPEDEYLAILDLIAQQRAGEIFGAITRLVDLGVDLGQFLTGFADLLRAQLALVLGAAPADISDALRGALESRREQLDAGDLVRMLNALTELEPKFRRSGQQQLLLELLLVRFALLDRTVSIEELLRQVGGGGGEGGGEDAAGTRRPSARPSLGSRSREAGPAASPRSRSETPTGVPRILEDSGPRHSRPASGPPSGPVARAGSANLALMESTVASAPPIAPAPIPESPLRLVTALDVNAIAGRWDELIAVVRKERRVLGSLLEHCLPTAVTASGVLTLQVDDATAQEHLTPRLSDVLGVLQGHIPGLHRLQLAGPAAPLKAAPVRMSTQSIRDDLVSTLRKRDIMLSAAIDELDLELID